MILFFLLGAEPPQYCDQPLDQDSFRYYDDEIDYETRDSYRRGIKEKLEDLIEVSLEEFLEQHVWLARFMRGHIETISQEIVHKLMFYVFDLIVLRKHMQLLTERNELHDENNALKAQVAQLQAMVGGKATDLQAEDPPETIVTEMVEMSEEACKNGVPLVRETKYLSYLWPFKR